MCAMSILSFTDIIQVRWKTFTWFCCKFIQETMYRISSKLPDFCRRCYKKYSCLLFFRTHHKE